MDAEKQQHYIQMARDNPNMLCSEVPEEILEQASYDGVEPSDFFKTFLEAGYTQWFFGKYGRTPMSREQITNGIIAVWVRACRLYISHVVNRTDPEWDKRFFSDESLYGR